MSKMKNKSNFVRAFILTATSAVTSIVLFSSAPAQAANLVRNGTFGSSTTGDTSPWNGDGTTLQTNLGGLNGNVRVINLEGSGSLQQTLSAPTILSQNYQLSFDLLFFDLSNSFKATVGSDVVFNQTNLTPPGDLKTSIANFVGNGSNILRFDYTIAGGSFQLANVSLDLAPSAGTTSVPEPLTIVGTLIGGTAALRLKQQLKSSKKSGAK
jgi:hypothetical protein